MSKAQVIHELGPPSAMTWQEWPVPDPGPGEVRLRHTAIGVNFADTYHRRGTPHPWPVPPCPVVIGFEGVGVVEEVGEGVADFNAEDRVAYGIPPLGSYAEVRNYPAEKLVHLPDGLDDRQVAALLMNRSLSTSFGTWASAGRSSSRGRQSCTTWRSARISN